MFWGSLADAILTGLATGTCAAATTTVGFVGLEVDTIGIAVILTRGALASAILTGDAAGALVGAMPTGGAAVHEVDALAVAVRLSDGTGAHTVDTAIAVGALVVAAATVVGVGQGVDAGAATEELADGIALACAITAGRIAGTDGAARTTVLSVGTEVDALTAGGAVGLFTGAGALPFDTASTGGALTEVRPTSGCVGLGVDTQLGGGVVPFGDIIAHTKAVDAGRACPTDGATGATIVLVGIDIGTLVAAATLVTGAVAVVLVTDLAGGGTGLLAAGTGTALTLAVTIRGAGGALALAIFAGEAGAAADTTESAILGVRLEVDAGPPTEGASAGIGFFGRAGALSSLADLTGVGASVAATSAVAGVGLGVDAGAATGDLAGGTDTGASFAGRSGGAASTTATAVFGVGL